MANVGPGPFYLNVVYAGRGDALIFEDHTHDAKRFVMIDGGPLDDRYVGILGTDRNPTAPYYRYLVAATSKIATDIGQTLSAVTPNAIVISHAHEDHYGGVMKMLHAFLSPDHNTSGPLVFNGPLLMPLTSKDGALDKELQKTFLFTRTEGKSGLPGFDLSAPASQWLCYERRRHALLGKDFSVDKSPDNIGGLLMIHKASGMVFTGDSIGFYIQQFIQVEANSPASPPALSIFKVPHHGSLRNSQLSDSSGGVDALARAEYGLYLVLKNDRANFPPNLTDLTDTNLDRARNVLLQLLGEQTPPINRDALLAFVQTRAQGALALIQANGSMVFKVDKSLLNSILQTQADPPLKVSDLWKKFVKAGHIEFGEALAGVKTRTNTYVSYSRSWFDDTVDDRCLEYAYKHAIAQRELDKFYLSFVSNVYIISADGSHGHPAAETIAAIAKAATAQSRGAHLFVTDGRSVKLDDLNALYPDWRLNLKIFYLAKRGYMKLDPSPQAFGHGNGTVDVDNVCEELDPNNNVSLDTLHDWLRSYRAQIPLPHARMYTAQVTNGQSGVSLYLHLSLGVDGALTVSISSVSMPLFVIEWWDLPSGMQVANQILLNSPVDGAACLFEYEQIYPTNMFKLKTNQGVDIVYVTMNGFTNDPNDPDIAIFIFIGASTPLTSGVHTAADSHAAADKTLAAQPLPAYLAAAGIEATDFTLEMALAAIVGPVNMSALLPQLAMPIDKPLLASIADMDASNVGFVSDAAGGLTVNSAVLVAKLPARCNIEVDGVPVTAAKLTLQWVTTDLAATLSITAAQGLTGSLTEIILVPNADRSQSLGFYLAKIGVGADQRAGIVAGALVAYMLKSEYRTERLFYQAPAGLNRTATPDQPGLIAWRLDHARSSVKMITSPTGAVGVEEAVLALVPPTASPVLTVAGFTLTLSDITLTVTMTRVADAKVMFGATATIGTTRLSLRQELTGDGLMTLELPGAAKLSDVVGLLPAGSPDLASVSIPMGGGPLAGLSLSKPGITLKQHVAGADSFLLASVHGTVDFTGWTSILPANFPSLSASSVRVEVFEPQSASHRRVGVTANFTFPVGTVDMGNHKAVAARFAAIPLVPSQPISGHEDVFTYAYELRLGSSPSGPPCSLQEVVTAALPGFGGLDTLLSFMPLLHDVMSNVSLVEIVVLLLDRTVSEFSVDLIVPGPWVLFGPLTVTTGELNLDYIGETWSGRASVDLLLADTYPVSGTLVLPTNDLPGSVSFDNPNGLSVSGFLQDVLGLPDLSGLPVIGTLLSAAVQHAAAVFSCSAAQPGTAALVSAECTMLLDKVSLGLLGDLTCVSASLQYTKKVVDSASVTVTTPGYSIFTLEAYWRSSFVATANFDGLNNMFTCSVRRVTPATMSIREMLSDLLGVSVPSALLPVIGDMALASTVLELNTSNGSLTSLSLTLVSAMSLAIGSTATRTCTMTDLVFKYIAGTDIAPSQYLVMGVLQGDNVDAAIELKFADIVTASIKSLSVTRQLTLTGLLQLFGLAEPAVVGGDLQSFLDLVLESASATLSTSPNLSLSALSALVHSTGQLAVLTTPSVFLSDLRLAIDYQHGRQPHDITGEVSGRLTVAAGGSISGQLSAFTSELWLAYGVDDAGPYYKGAIALGAGTNYSQLIAQFTGQNSVSIPTDVDLPAEIPLLTACVVVRPNKSIELYGHGAEVWSRSVSGVLLSVTQLGGGVVITQHEGSDPTTYQGYVYGSLAIAGYATADARMWLSSTERVLTAIVTKDGTVAEDPLKMLCGQLTQAPNAWIDVVPSNTASITLADMMYLHVDFLGSLLVLYGDAIGLGQGALLGRTLHDGRHSFVFSLALQPKFSISSIWPGLASTLGTAISLSTAGTIVSAYNGTGVQLKADMASVASYAHLQGVSFANPFAALEVADDAVVPTGMTIYAGLDLTGSGTLSHLVALGGSDQSNAQPSLLLSATINHTDPTQSVFSLAFRRFVLLGGKLAIDGTASYHPSDGNTLAVDGTVELQLGSTIVNFQCHVMWTVTQLTFDLKAGTTMKPDVPAPFDGKMRGVTIKNAALSGVFTFPTMAGGATVSVIDVSGTVELRGLANLSGHILFQNGIPQVVSVGFTTAWSVLDLFASVISGAPGGGGSWPASYSPITLKQGMLFYSDAATPITFKDDTGHQTVYQPGFHVSADISIFNADFSVDVLIPADFKGILVTGTVPQIDLYFVQLVAVHSSASGGGQQARGPQLTIDTRDPAGTIYSVMAGLKVFGADFLDITFSYHAAPVEADRYFEGRARYEGSLDWLKGKEVAFQYSDARGLRIVDFPLLADLQQLIDFAKAIEDAANASESACGEVVGLIFDKIVTSRFDVRLTQKADGPPVTSGNINFTLRGSYTIAVAGHDLASVPTPPIDFELVAAQPFDLDHLHDIVINTLVASAKSIAQSLWNAPGGTLTELFSLMSAKSLTKALVGTLLCRGIRSPNIVEFASELADMETDSINAPDGPATAADTALESAAAEWLSIEAGADLLIAASAAVTAFAAALAAFVGFLRKIWNALTGGNRDKKDKDKRDLQDKLDKARQQEQAATARIQAALAMAGGPLCSFADNLVVDWASVLPNAGGVDFYKGYIGFTFEVSISANADMSGASKHMVKEQTSLTVSDPDLRNRTIVFVTVQASYTRGDHTFTAAAPSPVSSAKRNVNRLRPPTSITQLIWRTDGLGIVELTFPPPWVDPLRRLSARIEIVDTHPTPAIMVAFRNVAESPGKPTVVVSFTGDELAMAASGAILVVRARCESAGSAGPGTFSDWIQSLPLTPVPAPIGVAVCTILSSDSTDCIKVNCPLLTPDVTGYVIQILKADKTPLLPEPAITWSLSGDIAQVVGVAAGQIISVRVRAKSNTTPTVWNRNFEAFHVVYLRRVTNLRCTFNLPAGDTTYSWDDHANPAGLGVLYRVAVTDYTSALKETVRSTVTATYFKDRRHAISGHVYQLTVQAFIGGPYGPESYSALATEADILLAPTIGPVLGLSVTYEPPDIVFAWTTATVDPRFEYEVRLLGPGRDTSPVTVTAGSLRIPATPGAAAGHLDPTAVTVAVRAMQGSSYGPTVSAAFVPGITACVSAQASFHKGAPAAVTASALLQLQPDVLPIELLALLAAGGYRATDARVAAATTFPSYTPEDWGRAVAALSDRTALARLLVAAHLSCARSLAVLLGLFQPPQQLISVIALASVGGVVDVPGLLQATLPSGTAAEASAMLNAVHSPWSLGPLLRSANLDAAGAVAQLRLLIPSRAGAMIVLQAGGYQLADAMRPLRAAFSSSADDLAVALAVVHDPGADPLGGPLDPSTVTPQTPCPGLGLARVLRSNGIGREAATGLINTRGYISDGEAAEAVAEAWAGPSKSTSDIAYASAIAFGITCQWFHPSSFASLLFQAGCLVFDVAYAVLRFYARLPFSSLTALLQENGQLFADPPTTLTEIAEALNVVLRLPSVPNSGLPPISPPLPIAQGLNELWMSPVVGYSTRIFHCHASNPALPTRLIISGNNTALYDPTSGRVTAGFFGVETVAAGDGQFYCTAANDRQKLLAIETTGRQVWMAEVFGQVVEGDHAVFVLADSTGLLTALDKKDGHVLWAKNHLNSRAVLVSGLAVGSGKVVYRYFLQPHVTALHAVEEQTGELAWQWTPDTSIDSLTVGMQRDNLLIADGVVFFAAAWIYFLNVATGQVICTANWKQNSSMVTWSVYPAKGAVFIGTDGYAGFLVSYRNQSTPQDYYPNMRFAQDSAAENHTVHAHPHFYDGKAMATCTAGGDGIALVIDTVDVSYMLRNAGLRTSLLGSINAVPGDSVVQGSTLFQLVCQPIDKGSDDAAPMFFVFAIQLP